MDLLGFIEACTWPPPNRACCCRRYTAWRSSFSPVSPTISKKDVMGMYASVVMPWQITDENTRKLKEFEELLCSDGHPLFDSERNETESKENRE